MTSSLDAFILTVLRPSRIRRELPETAQGGRAKPIRMPPTSADENEDDHLALLEAEK